MFSIIWGYMKRLLNIQIRIVLSSKKADVIFLLSCSKTYMWVYFDEGSINKLAALRMNMLMVHGVYV